MCPGVEDPAESVSPNLHSQTGGLHLGGQVTDNTCSHLFYLTWKIRDHLPMTSRPVTPCLTWISENSLCTGIYFEALAIQLLELHIQSSPQTPVILACSSHHVFRTLLWFLLTVASLLKGLKIIKENVFTAKTLRVRPI